MAGLLLVIGLGELCAVQFTTTPPTALTDTKEYRLNRLLDAALRLPGLYLLLAFLSGRRVVVRGRSMLPTLSPGEYVLFDRLAYRRRPPRRGDVVLAEYAGTRVVKRVAGAPGERVSLDGREWQLGEDEYLLVGDDLAVSTDSRDWGPLGRRAILARGWLVYWPPARMRHLSGADGPKSREGQA